jgi:hypothetical protein
MCLRNAASKAAKTSTTAASCQKYATGDHHVIVTWCPTDPIALLIANTISRLIDEIGTTLRGDQACLNDSFDVLGRNVLVLRFISTALIHAAMH